MTPFLHILGGGPAGLAAAHYAHARGLPFTLNEADAETGGNCRTLRLGECLYDTGAHRLHARDPEAAAMFRELLGDDLITVPAPSRIVTGAGDDLRSFRFPPEPKDLLRNLPIHRSLRAARELLGRAITEKPPQSPENFHDLAVGRYGKTLAELFLLGYTRKLWGRDPATLSPAVAGGRLDGLNTGTTLRKALGLATPGRDEHLDGAFLYPKHGIGSLFRALEARLPPGSVRVNSRVTRIRHDGTRLLGITLNGGEEQPVERVISTLPLPAFLRALDPLPPEDILARADRIAFRNLILCVVRLKMDGTNSFSENASLYFPDPKVPFTRLYEPRNRSPFMSPPGETCVVLEIPCDPGDDVWHMPDSEIARRTLESLTRTMGSIRGTVLEHHVQHIGHAYPVLESGTDALITDLLGYCARFSNLRLAGRNALFRYAHIHDMFRQGREAVMELSSL
jgi:protoporphyrinogen oxidase